MHPSIIVFRRLPARYNAVVQPLVLSVIMSGVVSAITTLRGLGLSPAFPATWLPSWGLSWVVAFPVLLAILPVVRRIVGWMVEPGGR
ncbi:DUF2798 domain-containing protein [Brevundimonas sp.]|uniref:DUF2798 domain-containing protein n=1 Tax=Brevundimonas sp. TaxID=1871086 RepID=UPI0025C07604|nr:DUF2798 domain-containing protein [Brevundimonas sp.]